MTLHALHLVSSEVKESLETLFAHLSMPAAKLHRTLHRVTYNASLSWINRESSAETQSRQRIRFIFLSLILLVLLVHWRNLDSYFFTWEDRLWLAAQEFYRLAFGYWIFLARIINNCRLRLLFLIFRRSKDRSWDELFCKTYYLHFQKVCCP